MADLVFRGALLCDGGGGEAARGDLAVRGDRIAAVGRVPQRGDVELDAAGLVLAPGFIDVHTHYDCQLFWDPSASPSPWHGVTTVVMGNCGFTIAPCREADRDVLMRLLLFVTMISRRCKPASRGPGKTSTGTWARSRGAGSGRTWPPSSATRRSVTG